MENVRLKKVIAAQEEELDVSTKYIQQLNKKIMDEHKSELPNKTGDEKIRELMNDYMDEQHKKANEDLDKAVKFDEKFKYEPDIIPVKGDFAISQKFSEKHMAIDLAAPTGTEVVAAAAGEILSVYNDEIFGNVIMIDHLNKYTTLYAHLATTFFVSNSTVEKGETIGLVGNTGNSSAPHLHYEIMVDGINVDPEEYIDFKK
jgi:murein DD-endopeptidase MepM/ murein hydrolase activator NlpD